MLLTPSRPAGFGSSLFAVLSPPAARGGHGGARHRTHRPGGGEPVRL